MDPSNRRVSSEVRRPANDGIESVVSVSDSSPECLEPSSTRYLRVLRVDFKDTVSSV